MLIRKKERTKEGPGGAGGDRGIKVRRKMPGRCGTPDKEKNKKKGFSQRLTEEGQRKHSPGEAEEKGASPRRKTWGRVQPSSIFEVGHNYFGGYGGGRKESTGRRRKRGKRGKKEEKGKIRRGELWDHKRKKEAA